MVSRRRLVGKKLEALKPTGAALPLSRGTPMPINPVEILLSSTRLYASLPVVGRHLEPFAGLTAMALYGGHYAPAAVRAAVKRRTSTVAADETLQPLDAAPVAN